MEGERRDCRLGKGFLKQRQRSAAATRSGFGKRLTTAPVAANGGRLSGEPNLKGIRQAFPGWTQAGGDSVFPAPGSLFPASSGLKSEGRSAGAHQGQKPFGVLSHGHVVEQDVGLLSFPQEGLQGYQVVIGEFIPVAADAVEAEVPERPG